ncbi:MAG: ParB/RepB/Spo0J family partition protein [Candidatus Margulisbacteria bacterium]|nr:ParB/RepB/Spo0J family partition protein [Candidatus Margulisiibacteriota bacterium]
MSQQNKPRLGRGLEALLPQKSLSGSGRTMLSVPISEIKTNPFQPRITFDEKELIVLSDSIKTHGLTQPIVVRRVGQGYELIAGERRLIACKMSQMDTIPVIVKNVTDGESIQLALVENLHREDLNAVEIAKGYQQVLSNNNSLSHRDLAKMFGKSRETISNTLRLLNLSKHIQDAVASGHISEGHARALLSCDDITLQDHYFERVKSEKWSVRRLEKAVSKQSPVKVTSTGDISELATLSGRLSTLLKCKVHVSGSLTSGKIIIRYESIEALQNIVNKLK